MQTSAEAPPNCAPGDNESEAAMATTDNNLHIPDDLLAQAEKLAASQGRTADDINNFKV